VFSIGKKGRPQQNAKIINSKYNSKHEENRFLLHNYTGKKKKKRGNQGDIYRIIVDDNIY